MPLPFFYKEDIIATAKTAMLDEDTSKHIVQVLRMQNGEQLQLTDGKGNLFTAEISDNNRKSCTLTILSTINYQPSTTNVTIAISLVKNNSRFEWFLEKVTEIGVTRIVPLLCQRTEKQHFRSERMRAILISAMLQSQQAWLPVLYEPIRYIEFIKSQADHPEKRSIAHCIDEGSKRSLADQLIADTQATDQLILIGPEGDFTDKEIEEALKNGFTPVSLGSTRLRTETAGVVAAALLVNRAS